MVSECPIILIVEDCSVTALLWERVALAHLPNSRPLWARNLDEARQRVSGSSINLFVLDVNLPDGSGLDFLWEMSTVQPDAKAVVMTGDPLPEYQVQSAALGALRFVEKPVSAMAIRQILKDALGATKIDSSEAASQQAFQASLVNLTPFDIVQLKCLASATTTLEFASQGQTGQIHLRKGNIVHARCGENVGMTALEAILKWRNGTAHEQAPEPATAETFDQPWQSILMEVAQAVDEQR
ncbi:DUF4388 domain-containing protein [Verrucomicrobiota bacterium sgz303538]